MQFRELRFVGKPDEKTRSVPVTVSSEAAVDRGDYVEILDHTPGGVDLSRAPLPLIESHDSTRLNIGLVEDLRVEGGRLRGTARFGESARAREVFADVKGRIVRGVSIGYELTDKGTPTPHASGRGRRFRFRPLEVSVVAVPADTSVGFYRSKDNTMQDDFNTGAAGDTTTMSRSQRRAASFAADDGGLIERERVKGIMALATSHNLRELGDRAISEGMPLEQFRGQALQALHERGSDRPLYMPAAQIGLSERETRNFSVTRLFRSLIENNPAIAPFERAAVHEVQTRMERAGHPAKRGGLMLPYELMTAPIPGLEVRNGMVMVGDRVLHRDLSTLSAGAGGAMVGTDHLAGDFITFLRARTLVRTMGAMSLGGLVGNVSIPRQTGTISPSWVAQAGLATEGDATYGVVTLQPKTVHGIQDVTRDLLLQGTPAVEGIIRADLLATMATAVDQAAIAGSGTSNEPTGILSTVGVGAVIGGTNGAAPVWDHLVELEQRVADANHDLGQLGYLTNPRVRAKLKRTQKFASTNGQEIWMPALPGDDTSRFGTLAGYRAGVSNHVPHDLVKGSSGAVCSAIVYGNFADILIGEWGTAEILPDPYTQAANRILRMHVYQSVDIAVRRAGSFAMMLDALTT